MDRTSRILDILPSLTNSFIEIALDGGNIWDQYVDGEDKRQYLLDKYWATVSSSSSAATATNWFARIEMLLAAQVVGATNAIDETSEHLSDASNWLQELEQSNPSGMFENYTFDDFSQSVNLEIELPDQLPEKITLELGYLDIGDFTTGRQFIDIQISGNERLVEILDMIRAAVTVFYWLLTLSLVILVWHFMLHFAKWAYGYIANLKIT